MQSTTNFDLLFTVMDAQKFLGLFEEILARELDNLPQLLQMLILTSGYKPSKNSDSDTPHRLLPSA